MTLVTLKFNSCSNHEMVEFRTLREGRRAKSKITSLNFRTADLGLFAWQSPQDKTLEGKGVQESWLIFKDHLLQAQEKSIPTSRK